MGQVSRFRIVILCLLFGLTGIWVYRPAVLSEYQRSVPLAQAISHLPGWQAAGFHNLSAGIIDELKLDDYLFRSYGNGGGLVTLYVGYYFSAKKVGAAHDPMVCYPGQGWQVMDPRRGVSTLPGGLAVAYSTMTAGLDGKRELILYWFQAYDRTAASTFSQKYALLRQKLAGHGEDNAFVRISTPIDGTEAEARERLISFLHEFYPLFYRYVVSDAPEESRTAALTGAAFPDSAGGPGNPFAVTILIISLAGLCYVYVGYPAAAFLIARVRPRPVRKGETEPTVTIVIAAYNEEEAIGATIENKLALDYPAKKLEILVVSDGSTDRTDQIVRRYADRNVRLLRQEPRAGKTSGLNLAVPVAAGEIIVFSDANSLYAPDALRRLVANFADPEVGYVTGRMVYVNPDGTANGEGCSTYMKYENALREIETRLGSVVGVDGGIDAIRKSLYRPMNADQLPDFVLPLQVVDQGFRVVYEPDAHLREAALSRSADEYRMRVRVSLRALWALSDMRHLLCSPRNALFCWQLWSHKVLRYLCFLFLIGAFFGNAALLENGFGYQLLFAFQVGAYIGAVTSPALEKRGHRLLFLAIPSYFALLNMAAAHGFGKFLLGHKQVVWTPRKG